MKKLILQILKEETQQITEKFKVSPDEYVKLFKNDNFELVVPLTFEASKKYGANAKWCTTTRCDDTMFNKHNEMGSLAYLIIKNPEIAQRLGNTKYGLFINKPDDNYLGGKYAAPSGIMMYGDNNSILSQSQVENEFDKLDLLSDYYKMIRSFTEYSESKFSKESIQESYKDNINDNATQIFNSLLKRYIPDNSTFETWFSQPYYDNERVDVYIEYSFDEEDTHFWKTDVQEDDEPQRYEGTIYLLINRLMIGNVEDDTWEDVGYYDLPDYIWEYDFNTSVFNKIQPILKSFNLDVDFDYKFIEEEK
jgi:hypothetical protein